MRRRAGWILVALLAGCGEEPAAPRAPSLSAPEPRRPAGAGLLPKDTFFYVEADSVEAVDGAAPWMLGLLGFRLRSALEGDRLCPPKDLLDAKAPLALALAGSSVEDCYGIVITPVLDAERARAAAAERGATARASGSRVGIAFDARYVPADAPLATDLPEGIVRGRVDLAPLLDRFEEQIRDVPRDLSALVTWLRRFESVSFGVAHDGDTLRLDVFVGMRGAGEAAASDLAEVLSWLPRDATLVLAEDVDRKAVEDAIRPLLPVLTLADPAVEKLVGVWTWLDRGAVASMSFGARGPEIVVVAKAKEPGQAMAAYVDHLRSQAGVLGVMETGPDLQVEGVTLHTLYVRPRPPEAEYPALARLGGESTVHVFRIVPPKTGAPPDWAEHDRAAAEERLRAVDPTASFVVTADDEYLYVQRNWYRLATASTDESWIEANIGGGGVRIRRAVDPDHPSYATCLAILDDALERDPGRREVPIPAGKDAEFPDGLLWCPIARAAAARLPRPFQQKDHFLVALDKVDLCSQDVAWAYVSDARLGEDAPTRDVAYRLSDAAVPRAQAITKGNGTRYVAAVVAGEVVAGARLDEPHSACGDFRGLSPEVAQGLVSALSSRPFHAAYVAEGEKPESFLRARESERALTRVFGEKGLPIRYGAVGDRIVLVGGHREGLAEEVLARVRGAKAAPVPALDAALREAPGAQFLCKFDMVRFGEEFAAMQDALMPERLRTGMGKGHESDAFFPGMPRTLDPFLFAICPDGRGFRLRVRFDGRLLTYFAAERDRSRTELARLRAASIGSRARLWQTENRTTRLPTAQELDGFGLDPWGEGFRIEEAKDGLRVVSAGPDGAFGTADDIAAEGKDEWLDEPEIPLEEPEPDDR